MSASPNHHDAPHGALELHKDPEKPSGWHCACRGLGDALAQRIEGGRRPLNTRRTLLAVAFGGAAVGVSGCRGPTELQTPPSGVLHLMTCCGAAAVGLAVPSP